MNCFRVLAVAGIAVWPAPAVEAAPDAAIGGTFCGSMYAGEKLVDAVTKFAIGAAGEIRGTYKFMEGGLAITGGLIAIAIDENRKADFRWIDRYGNGRLVVTFDAEWNTFSGYWSGGEHEPEFPWFGQRCSDTAEPGQVT